MSMKKVLAGICSLALLFAGMPSGTVYADAPPDWGVMPENFDFYKGDLSGNYAVDITDIVIMQKYLGGKLKFSERYFQIADMNQDDAVNIYDFILLKKAVLSGQWDMVLHDEPVEPTENPDITESDNFIKPPVAPIMPNLPSQGTGNLVIFYVDFPDCRYDYEPTVEQLNQIAFGEQDSSNTHYPFESMKAFFERSSKGVMNLNGQAFRYTARNNMDYYANNKDLLSEECYEAFDNEIDFSQFDGNHDGKIDATLVSVPMTADGNTSDSPWWCMAGDSGSENSYDGKELGHLITGNAQVESITDYKNFNSSYQHEMGHCMGLPDYYLYYSEDYEGFHGESQTAGMELMDADNWGDFSCFSKLQLGWYKESQISVYDQNQGGEQTFTLVNAQTENGNCLILPYGETDYSGEYLILEYITPQGNNVSTIYPWITSGNGIRAYHVKAEQYNNGWWTHFKYENGSEFTNFDDEGIRLIRLVNDAEGGAVFTEGQVLDGNISGWHWYAQDESESVDTGYTVTINNLKEDAYTVTVSRT